MEFNLNERQKESRNIYNKKTKQQFGYAFKTIERKVIKYSFYFFIVNMF